MKTAFQNITLSIRQQIAWVTLNRPNALNALNSSLLNELSETITELQFNDDIRLMVITGEGKAFAAGADIAEMQHFSPQQALAFSQKGARLYQAIEALPIPVIAAINGYCLGGGCELSLACDIRYASDQARFGQPEVSLGLIPGFSGTQRLPRLIGTSYASELIFSGKIIDANEALRIGLVNKVVPRNELIPEVEKLASLIARQSPNAVALSKQAIKQGLQTVQSSGIEIECNLFAQCFSSPQHTEGIRAFLAKEKPNF